MKAKTKVILGSAMTATMCASLIAGSTFALFTSESKTNIAITAGKVAVLATIDETSLHLFSYAQTEGSGDYVSTEQTPGAEGNTTFAMGGTASFVDGTLTLANIVPGDKATFDITVTNNSTVNIKYQYAMSVSVPDVDGANFLDKLDVTFNGAAFPKSDFVAGSGYTAWDAWETPAADDAKVKKVPVTVELPYDYNDEFGSEGSIQGKSFTLAFTVNAVQGNANTDDPETEPGKMSINSLEEFLAFSSSVANEENGGYEGKEIFLKTDIDFEDIKNMGATFALNAGSETASNVASVMALSAEEWTPIGTSEYPFKGTFNGGNHTIYNLSATGTSAGLFAATEGAKIMNLTIANANVTASKAAEEETSAAGVLVGEAKGALTVENVTIESSTVAKAEGATATLGALVGTTSAASDETPASVTVNNTEVEMSKDSAVDEKLVGSDIEVSGAGNFLETVIAEGFTKKTNLTDKTYSYEISSADGLAAFRNDVNGGNKYSGQDIYLTSDINLDNEEWEPIGSYYYADFQYGGLGNQHTFNGNFHGNDHTIRNLTISDEPTTGKSSYYPVQHHYLGLFGLVYGGTVENVKLIGVTISGYRSLGGVVGYMSSNATVRNCSVENVHITVERMVEGYSGYTGKSSDTTDLSNLYAGTIVGQKYSGSLENCTGEAVITLVTKEGSLNNVHTDPANTAVITSFGIANAEEYAKAAGVINANEFGLGLENSRKDPVTMIFAAAGNYDFAEVEYKPASIKGYTVEGNGAVIKNLNAADENGWAGLFGSIENSTVKDLTFNGATLEGCDVGVVAGKAINSTFTGITVKGDVNLSWVAKLGMDYSRSGIGLLTGYWDNKDASIAPEASLECNATINYGKIAYALITGRPYGLIWADTTHYFGTVYSSYGSYVQPQTTGVAEKNGYTLNTENFAERGKLLQVDDKVTLGSYPQSKVEDDGTINALNAKKTGEWTDSNNKPYQDITLENGEKYRGVKNEDGTVEWFSFDPITWRVVQADSYSIPTYTLLADCILDNQMYYSSDAAHSNSEWIYSWLKDTFTGTAFGETDSAQYNLLQNRGQKVSLLPRSTAETFQTEWKDQQDKWLKGSDYAVCQGLNHLNPWWIERNSTGSVEDAYMYNSYMVSGRDERSNKYGVAPIICLNSEIGFLTFD